MTVPDKKAEQLLVKLLDDIQLPDQAYETAIKRYENLGEWYLRPNSSCAGFEPEIFAQGSFRLGTATNGEHYDLDIGCKLNGGLTTADLSQAQLKTLVGDELEAYRVAHGVKEELTEKRRCWQLAYADGFSFHLDVVPCIPETDHRRSTLRSRMLEESGFDETLASDVSVFAVSITDIEHSNYSAITPDWLISNPQGYARWFESRMRTAVTFLEHRALDMGANIEDVPMFRWKTPLQGAIQLLKHHRNTMFASDNESQPISIIITTLAARAYAGETSLAEALERILATMGELVNQTAPRVPNPVNPAEDFADKWDSRDHSHLELEHNFKRWLIQARAHFAAILRHEDVDNVIEAANRGFGVNLDKRVTERVLGLAPVLGAKVSTIHRTHPQPWCE